MSNTKQHVYIIDDSEMDRMITQKIIESSNLFGLVKLFKDGESALKFFSGKISSADKRKGDVILCDIQMPNMNGFKFAEAFKELDLPGYKFFFLSSSWTDSEFVRANNNPIVTDVLKKGLDIQMLLRRLR